MKFVDLLSLTKPRIVTMVLVTTALGYLLGAQGNINHEILTCLLIGTCCTAAGGAALNHYAERDYDSLMQRTRNRPLVNNRLEPRSALVFGLALALFGVTLLAVKVNLITTSLAAITAILYIAVYTPLKRKTWLNTFVGAIPGALPPVGGWAAATEEINLGAWLLFAILFVWQHPHFYAIAWIYKEDYAKAGFKMLPSVDTEGTATFRQIMIYSVLLVPVSLLPAIYGLSTSALYVWGATALGVMMLTGGVVFRQTQTNDSARSLLYASLLYLPALFTLIALDLFVIPR